MNDNTQKEIATLKDKNSKLEKRIEKLEKVLNGQSPTVVSDLNIYKAVQRALQTNNLTLGGGINSLPQESSILSLNSRSKGMIVPRTDNLTLITNPIEGMLVYNYDHEALETYNGQQWGFTLPRLTDSQMQALTTPIYGMVVYNSSHDAIEVYNGTDWGQYVPSTTETERDALVPIEGMFVFNDTTNKLNFYDGTTWRIVTST